MTFCRQHAAIKLQRWIFAKLLPFGDVVRKLQRTVRQQDSGSGCFVSSNLMLGVPVYGWNASLGYTDSRNEGHYVYRAQLKKNDSEFGDGAPWETVYMTRSRSRGVQLGLNRSFN